MNTKNGQSGREFTHCPLRRESAPLNPINEVGPRESMARLPVWSQPIWTMITGKALASEKPYVRRTTSDRAFGSFLTFVMGIIGAFLLVELGGIWQLLLPVAWLLTVSAIRLFQVEIVHYASHGVLFSNQHLSKLIAEFVSVLGWIQPLSGYAKDHPKHHSATATKSDPDLRFLVQVTGLQLGLSIKAYWIFFWKTMFAPRFHYAFLRARLRANLIHAPLVRRLASWGFASALAVAIAAGLGRHLLLGYFVPVLLVQPSAWGSLLGLHHWVRRDNGRTKKEVLADLTSARFVGAKLPSESLRGIAAVADWMRWIGYMLFVAVPSRLAFVQGSLSSHDFHHNNPQGDWANSAYSRAKDLAENDARRPLYNEIWGVGRAINETFKRFSEAPPGDLLLKDTDSEKNPSADHFLSL